MEHRHTSCVFSQLLCLFFFWGCSLVDVLYSLGSGAQGFYKPAPSYVTKESRFALPPGAGSKWGARAKGQ
eukprot:2511718-Amphidinium_carterae.1